MGGVHQFIGKIQRKWKLAEADHVWYMTGGPCWGDYPPSFYARHTQREICDIRESTCIRVKEMIECLDEI